MGFIKKDCNEKREGRLLKCANHSLLKIHAVNLKNLIGDILYLISKMYICVYFNYRMDKKTEEFYIRLKEELNNTSSWPSEYLYKFIVPTDSKKIEEVENAFDNMGAVIKTHPSKAGKYTSISVNLTMNSPADVVEKYIEVSTIEGIISF